MREEFTDEATERDEARALARIENALRTMGTPSRRLSVVRDSAPPPRLELPRARPAWVDGAPFALGAVALLFAGAIGIAVAMGWIR